MKTSKIIFTLLTLVLLVGVLPAEAAMPGQKAAAWAWTVEEFAGDEAGVLNLSTAFVGAQQIPMFSYSLDDGAFRIYQAYLAPAASYRNCGPDDRWTCATWWHNGLDPQSVSNVATHLVDQETFSVMWAYRVGNQINVSTMVIKNNMVLWADTWEQVVDVDKFGDLLVEAPSLQFIDGHYQMAFTTTTFVGERKLVYMSYSGIPNTSCRSGGSQYQCEVIETTAGSPGISAPSLKTSPDGGVGIAYMFEGDLKYTYPWPLLSQTVNQPANCGPGGDTWRCIKLFDSFLNAIGSKVRQGVGLTSLDRSVAFTDSFLMTKSLWVAAYVGSDGNCGVDGDIIAIHRWQCSNVDNFNWNPFATFSLAVDPEGFPVVAYDNTYEELAPTSFYLTYPKTRVGESGDGWIRQTIDSPPHGDVDIGRGSAIALNEDGLGFIVYQAQDNLLWTEPLKIALQKAHEIFLPLIQN